MLSTRSGNASSNAYLSMAINGVSTSRTGKVLYGTGSVTGSYSDTSAEIGDAPAASSTASTFGNTSIYFTNYAGSSNKSFSLDGVRENNATSSTQQIQASLWSSTAAITNLSFTIVGNFVQYSTASLYLVTKGSGGASVS